MIRPTAILLCTIFLLGSVFDFHDLKKIPYLIQHYNQHRAKSSDVSFIEFLSLHYGGQAERHDKEEHEKHEGLPFKSQDCTSAHVISLAAVFLYLEMPSQENSIRYNRFYKSVFISEFSHTIWQPPKIA